jgi:hypothetical protein
MTPIEFHEAITDVYGKDLLSAIDANAIGNHKIFQQGVDNAFNLKSNLIDQKKAEKDKYSLSRECNSSDETWILGCPK